MPRLPFRGAPWLLALDLAMVLREHYSELTPKERSDLQGIRRASRGNPRSLSEADRRRLGELVRRLDLVGAGKSLVPIIGRRQRRGRRR